ncbi:sulfite exporter TauE/SafE family protein [Bifidobacterium tibiigranuli]|uniref:Probable membrane transporter protein n=1 Tax=Bifidobacterium tibiigranuli TaxID=2172043 RepID=A0A5N6SBI9_9BIFI|nr:sulfite exporter TauE/SafE family protein [Bifidobacterium tibiigranuli]KAE8130484.1 sulfite exporter TauE/SafE family protein [Bifidobacterium tibiigranuli]
MKEVDVSSTMRDALFLAVLFATNVIQAITGFAGTVLAMPASMLLIGTGEARVILNAMAFASCLWIGIQDRRHIRWRELARIVGFMAIGMAVGILLYGVLPLAPMQKAYGIFIILVAVRGLFFSERANPRRWVLIAILLLAGVVHGLFVSGGALLVMYAVVVLRDKNEFRATVSCVWVVLNAFMGAQQVVAGEWNEHALMLAALGLPLLAVSIVVGNRLQQRISQHAFLLLTYVLLIISGISIVL